MLSLSGHELLMTFRMNQGFVVECVGAMLAARQEMVFMEVFFVEEAFTTDRTHSHLELGKLAMVGLEGIDFVQFPLLPVVA